MIKKWLKERKQFIIAAVLFSLLGTGVTFALPYLPSDAQLDPSCAPGDTNCYVAVGDFTLPALTSGSVLFSNGSTISQDNTNFFWDDTDNELTAKYVIADSVTYQNGAFAKAFSYSSSSYLGIFIGKQIGGGVSEQTATSHPTSGISDYGGIVIGQNILNATSTSSLFTQSVLIGEDIMSTIDRDDPSLTIAIGSNIASTSQQNQGIFIGQGILANSTASHGYTASNGHKNLAIGRNSLSRAQGGFNVALGTLALAKLTTGSDNTAVGVGAGNLSQTSVGSGLTGSQNTFLGAQTNWTVDGIVNSTAVGFGASLAQSNSVVLGNGANIGIGDNTPAALLTVGSGDLFQVDTSGNTSLFSSGDLRFVETGGGTDYVGFQAPATIAANTIWTLPSSDSSGCLQSNGSGTLSIASCGGGSGSLSGLSAAAAANTINNTNYQQEWEWNTLAATSGLKLSSNSTAAASNTQRLLEVSVTGVNGTSTQTTYGGYFSNTHSGTASTNVALYASATGGTNNYAAIFENGLVGIGNDTPRANLEITGTAPQSYGNLFVNAASGSGFININAATGDETGINIMSNGVLGWEIYRPASSSDLRVFYSDDVITFQTDGDVGIGTSTPQTALQVSRDAQYVGGYAQIEAIGGTNQNKRLSLGFDTTVDKGYIQAGITASSYNDLLLNPNDGNVGIANPTPLYKLDVLNSTTGQTTSQRVLNVSNTGADFDTTGGAITSYGGYFTSNATESAGGNILTNIGIYATANGADANWAGYFEGRTVVHNTGANSFLVVDADAANESGVRLSSAGNSKWEIYRPGTTDDLRFYSDVVGDDVMSLTSGGKVGIGDASPAALFTVGSGDKFQIDTSGNTFLFSSADLRFVETGGGADYIGFQAPAAVTSSFTWTLPSADSSGCFQSNGSGTLSIASCGGGGGITIGTTAVTSGTVGRILVEGAGNVVGESPNLFWDAATSRLVLTSDNTTGNTTSSAISLDAYALTSGTGMYITGPSLTSGKLMDLSVASTAASGNTQTVLNIATSGANATTTQTTYGAQFSNTHTGTSSTNIGLYSTASGATNNYAAIFAAGNVGVGDSTPASLFTVGSGDLFQVNSSGAIVASTGYIQSSGTMSLTSANTTQTTTSSAFVGNFNSLTSGTGMYLASSTLSSGSLVSLVGTGTAAASNTQTILNVSTSGANATSAQTTYGGYFSNTHTGTTAVNVGLYATASGAPIDNFAIVVGADIAANVSPFTIRSIVGGGTNGTVDIVSETTTIGYNSNAWLTGGNAINTTMRTASNDLHIILRPRGTGKVGVSTSAITPDRLLHSEIAGSGTNTIDYPLRLTNTTSGTATIGYGVGQEFEAESGSGTNRVVGTFDFPFSDATNASEDTTFNLSLIRGGTLTTAFTVDSLGFVGIGDTTPDFKLDVESDVTNYVASIFNDGNNANRSGLFIQAGLDDHTAAGPSTLIGFADGDGTAVGSITFGSSATAYNTTSDQRLKENIVNTQLTLNALMDIKIRDYTWIADSEHKLSHGVIAQELYLVYPQAVTRPIDESTGTWMVDYSKLTPLVIKSIQDLKLDVDTRFAELASLDTTLANSFGWRVKSILENAGNGIDKIFTKEIETKKLCVADDSGSKTCVTKSELDAVLLQASVNNSQNNTPAPDPIPDESNEPSSDPESNPEPEPTPNGEIAPTEDPNLNP